MTKKQLRAELDALTSEYLGFPTTCGLPQSASHALLERRLLVYRRMLEHQREFLRLQAPYTNEQKLMFGMGWYDAPALEQARKHRESASFAWTSPDRAAEALRVNGDF